MLYIADICAYIIEELVWKWSVLRKRVEEFCKCFKMHGDLEEALSNLRQQIGSCITQQFVAPRHCLPCGQRQAVPGFSAVGGADGVPAKQLACVARHQSKMIHLILQ